LLLLLLLLLLALLIDHFTGVPIMNMTCSYLQQHQWQQQQ